VVCGDGRGGLLPIGARRRQAATPRVWRPATAPEFIAQFAATLAGLPQPIRLILDDVHELVDPHALESLRAFIRVKPATVQLVLASRFDPPLSLPGCSWPNGCGSCAPRSCPSHRRKPRYCWRTRGLRPSPQEVEVVHRRTGGVGGRVAVAALGLAESGDHDAFLTQFSVMTARSPTTWSVRSSAGCPPTCRTSCA
jgi:LuxR family transcriptional regulator, maltose regulon positive regulatory protein